MSCELLWPKFSDIFRAEKVSRRNKTKTHTGTQISKAMLWQSMGTERGFHTSTQPVLGSQTSRFGLPNKIFWLANFLWRKSVEFLENCYLKGWNWAKGWIQNVRKPVVMAVAFVWGRCMRVWCTNLCLRNDLCIHHNSSHLLPKTYRLYFLHFCLENTPTEDISVYREVNRLQKSAVCWFSSW